MWGLFIRFGAWLLGGLVAMMPTLVGKVLIGLGISVVTYTGVSASLGWLKAGAISAFLGLPPGLVGILSLMKVGVCVSMVFSAIMVRMTMNGLSSDTVKNFVKR